MHENTPMCKLNFPIWVQEQEAPGYKECVLLFDISACSMSDQIFHRWKLRYHSYFQQVADDNHASNQIWVQMMCFPDCLFRY